MTRLFLDANVLFTAAHNPKGKAALIISLGQHRLVELATSAYAGEEARRNLARKFPKALEPFETMLANLTIVADDITIACPASLAEKDRPIYRAAHACKADVLQTGDLRDFGPFMNQPQRTGGLLIQTVASFLDGL
jgi:predicted nucleic acid-binding protein